MKHLIITFCLMASFTSNAQTVWSPPGATWHYTYQNFGISGYVKIEYISDSVILGKSCKALEKSYSVYNYFTMSLNSAVFDTTYTYASNDSVFYLDDNEFYLLYDFSASPADLWKVGKNDNSCSDSLAQVVCDSTGNVTINSFILPWVSVSSTDSASIGMEGKVIERFGCFDFYMFPEYVDCIFDGEEGGPLRCYSDDVFGTYEKPGAPACEFVVGFDQLNLNPLSIKLFPNPASNNLHIELEKDNTHELSYQIIDYSGKELRSESSNQSSVNIDISGLTEGSYLLKISIGGVPNRIISFVKNAP